MQMKVNWVCCVTQDTGLRCLFYKHRSPWEVAANEGGATGSQTSKTLATLTDSTGPSWMDAWPLAWQALGNFWLLTFCYKLHSPSERGSSEYYKMVLWIGVLIPFLLGFLPVSHELCFLHQWGAAGMNCCCGIANDLYFCATGKEWGGGGGSGVCKSKASLRQDGDSVSPHVGRDVRISVCACGGPDLIAKQQSAFLEYKLSPLYSLGADSVCLYSYSESADVWQLLSPSNHSSHMRL